MARYINAEKAEKDGWSASRTYPQDAHTMVYETKKMTDFPSADVAEVVRCKDCVHRHQTTCPFLIANAYKASSDDDFCSRGRKER